MSYLMFVTGNDFRIAIHKKHLRMSADNVASRLTPLPMYINRVHAEAEGKRQFFFEPPRKHMNREECAMR
jgi:hypothetical protein